MGSSSLLLVVTTALITWVVATFVISLRHNYDGQHKNALTTIQIGGRTSSYDYHDHRAEVAPMQGGNRTFKKKLRSYVNMTDYTGPSTTWKPYPHEFPCFPAEPTHMLTTPAHEGLLFQRPVKTGSTSLTSIILRLSYSRGSRLSEDAPVGWCKYRAMHGASRTLDFVNRQRDRSYLLSVVRDPTLKAISRYFHFDVSVGQQVPTDAHFQMIMRRPYNRNDLMQNLMTRPNRRYEGRNANATQMVLDILADYDFIAVTERMDESLVVWKILFNLDFYDILYIKARESGSFSNGDASKGRPCVYLVPMFLTPGMQDFFESKEWKDSNAIDILLYQAIYKSLDNTIVAIGKERVQKELEIFLEAKKIAESFCEGKVRGVCSPGGTFAEESARTCVVWGEGCDLRCLARFRGERGLAKLLATEQVAWQV